MNKQVREVSLDDLVQIKSTIGQLEQELMDLARSNKLEFDRALDINELADKALTIERNLELIIENGVIDQELADFLREKGAL